MALSDLLQRFGIGSPRMVYVCSRCGKRTSEPKGSIDKPLCIGCYYTPAHRALDRLHSK